ncbi:MAG: hypothetical protein GY802_02285, partial [Gammaproteobacteria bacterium]|nr:hypothetical protein [Gammaproteobacteria bacterium]
MDKKMNNTATTSCQLSRFAACALMLVLAYVPAVQAAKSLSVGTTVNGSNWKGDNGSGNSDFESDRGGQLAASVSYRVDKFYTGLNLQGG